MTLINKTVTQANVRLGIPLPDQSVDVIITDPPYDFDDRTKNFIHSEFLRVCCGDILVFSPPENQWEFDDLTRRLFWIKSTSTKNFSRNYGKFVEMIFLYKRSRVWNTQYNWSNYTGVYTDLVLGSSGHPFEKPYSLMERFVLLHSDPGFVILDPFCGSGVVLDAAVRNGREAIGFDSAKKWVE